MIHTDGVRTIAHSPDADLTATWPHDSELRHGLMADELAELLDLPAKSAALAASWDEDDEGVCEPQPRPLTHFHDYLGRVIDAELYVTLKMGNSEIEGWLEATLSTGGVTAIREVALDLITVVPTDMIDGVKFDGHDADSIDLETPLAHDHRRYDF